MITAFGRLLHQLRLETGEENLKHQADLLNMTSRNFSHLIRSKEDEIKPEWIKIIQKEYNLTKKEFNERLKFYLQQETDRTVTPRLRKTSKFGALLKKLCREKKMTLVEFCEYNFYPIEYIVFLCENEKIVDTEFITQIIETYDMSDALLERFNSFFTEQKNIETLDMTQRTPMQRILMWYVIENIYIFNKDLYGFFDRFRVQATASKQIYSDTQTPVSMFLSEFMQRHNFSNQDMMDGLHLSDFLLQNTLEGTYIPESIDDLIKSRNPYFTNYCYGILVKMSSSEFHCSEKLREDKEKEEFISNMYTALPYFSDSDIEEILKELWNFKNLLARRSMVQARRSYNEKLLPPVGCFLKDVMKNSKVPSQKLAEEINISPVEFSAIIHDRVEISYNIFQNIRASLGFRVGYTEVFRIATELSRRAVVTNTSYTTVKQRIIVQELQNALSKMSEADADEILDILHRLG